MPSEAWQWVTSDDETRRDDYRRRWLDAYLAWHATQQPPRGDDAWAEAWEEEEPRTTSSTA